MRCATRSRALVPACSRRVEAPLAEALLMARIEEEARDMCSDSSATPGASTGSRGQMSVPRSGSRCSLRSGDSAVRRGRPRTPCGGDRSIGECPSRMR